MRTYYLPEREFSPIDALNRRAAALGSPRYAELSAHADYNGHQVRLTWNNYRGYYVAEYFWAGRVVLARGSFFECLSATLSEWRRGALGSSAVISPRADDLDAALLCENSPDLVLETDRSWYSWRHTVAAESARDYANPYRLVRVFDWDLLQLAVDESSYTAAVVAKHGRAWTT